jgi:hypothetical protein
LTPITNDTVGVVIVGNRITGTTSSDAINLTVIGPSAHVVVGDNVVSKGPFGGIALTMNVEDLFLRMNGNSITEVDGDGLRITIDSEDLDFPGIVDLTVDSAGGTGLNIMASGWDTAIDGLVLVNHTNLDAGYAAIALSWAKNVSLIDSRVNTSAANFLVSQQLPRRLRRQPDLLLEMGGTDLPVAGGHPRQEPASGRPGSRGPADFVRRNRP